MKTARTTQHKNVGRVFLLLALLLWLLSQPMLTQAKDTDIYAVSSKQNCYVLMDSSGSMAWGVYEHSVDYGTMYDYLFKLNDTDTPAYNYINDSINSDALYGNHAERNKIYLITGDINVAIVNSGGKDTAFTGDPGNDSKTWGFANKVDTHTLIDENGNLSGDGSGQPQRITVDSDGYVLFDNAHLPLGMKIKLHDLVPLYDGSTIDNGFGGAVNAPGYYFSGYEGIDTTAPYTANDQAENGDEDIFFFTTGNWINMQAVLNLTYNVNPPGAANSGDQAWKYEAYPLGTAEWSQKTFDKGDYPSGSGQYANNLSEASTAKTITHPGALKMRVHFSYFDVEGNNNAGSFTKDYVKIYNSAGAVVAQYDNDNKPTKDSDGWSPVITGNTAIIKLFSNGSTRAYGYTIDKIAVTYTTDAGGSATYLMQSRLDVAKDAMTYVVDEFRGKMNWGFASFKNGDGAQLGPFLNPTDNDDAQRAAIVTQINGVTAEGGTPLMEALQDVWKDGYYDKNQVLGKDPCRKNYVISMTDGFPSVDTDAGRIPGVTFADWDNDNWTQDPSQYDNPSEDFYDDVAHWMYTHSWMDQSLVTDPANSYVNVITHHISFGAKHPLLENAAKESGGQFIAAYNKEQLVSAFYSLALSMAEAVTFTAPVVSVDAVNKIQSGDDLYMGLFLPQASTYWTGNVKKFKLGDGSTTRPKLFMIYDKANNEAIDGSGQFLDNTTAFWGDDLDVNDTDNYGAADIKEDGAGEVLLEDVKGFLAAGTFWKRPIYTWKRPTYALDEDTGVMVMKEEGAIKKFDRDNITAADLEVADDATRDKLINFIHGYTYDAIAGTGAPVAVREWILGAIIHSRPVVVDYFDTANSNLPLLKRFVTVGSNDGMLHVFDDTNGREAFAFIPTDILPKLKDVQANYMTDTVDGLITLYRKAKNPKYLIFGERRGGGTYWSLDISNMDPSKWTVAWDYTNSEITQSWSEVKVASIPVAISANGEKTYKDVAIFTGGYDPEEDNFPEPFTDVDSNGTPYKTDENIDNAEWSQATATQDVYNDNQYNKYNPELNEYGRGFFVVDIDDPTDETSVTLTNGKSPQILPFSSTYGAIDVTTGATQKFQTMKFSFPASPSVVTGTDKYFYKSSSGQAAGFKENTLLALYAVDVYTNLFKTRFTFDVENTGTETAPIWKATSAAWTVNKLFNANPGSKSGSGTIGGEEDTTDQGRKAFYPPAISWGGSKGYFEAGNYYYSDTTIGNATFNNVKTMASLFFGTGDREHPKYTMIRNRFYAVYDDSSVTAKLQPPSPPVVDATDVPVTSSTYNENDLLNLTCDELGKDTVITSGYTKEELKALLRDDAVYGSPSILEYGATHENDAKGWYIILEDQGKSTVCSHVTYPTTINTSTGSSHDNHSGEQVLSQALLYYGTLYFTTYQASISDPCHPQGNGFSYALDYLDGSAAYDLNTPSNSNIQDITDRYKKFSDIYGIPSGFTIILRDGHAAAMASMGGAIIGPGPDPNNPFEIATSGLGLEIFYWRDSNSQQ